jgi:hypothetical protein
MKTLKQIITTNTDFIINNAMANLLITYVKEWLTQKHQEIAERRIPNIVIDELLEELKQ